MANPAFTPNPPKHQQISLIRLRRVGIQPVTAICTAQKPLGVLLHYHHGRTIPHFHDTYCEPCADGNTPRWKGYLTLYDPKTRQHWLQEYTPAAHDGITDGLTHFETIRGHLIRFERIRHAHNAPMRSEVYLSKTPEADLPPEPDMVQLLYRIWQLEPTTTPPDTTTDKTMTHARLNRPKNNGQPHPTPLAHTKKDP